MHIVYLVEQIDKVGGIERSLTTRVNYLVKVFKYKVTIVCTLKNSGIPSFKLDDSVNVIFLDNLTTKKTLFGRFFLRLKQAKCVINDLKPDILISVKFTLHNLFFLVIPSKVKFISEIRETYGQINNNSNSNLKSIINLKIRNFVLKKQDIMIVLTEEDKKNWGFKNIRVVPNPHTVSTEIVSDLKKNQVLALGRLHKVKGFDKLLEVWKLVCTQHSDWILKICGEGEEYENLLVKIDKLNISKNVTLTNQFFPVVPEFLNSSIFVLTSQFEAFGNVLVEAKICGVPSVSFDSPSGPKEIIIDGEDGFIVGFNNIEEMADKIIFLIEHSDVRILMGKKARINAKKYDLDVILQLYNKVILQ